jgi:hypothetical protein
MGLSAIPLGFIPLAFASAIIRYRLMDVEIILKRLLIYTSRSRHRRDLRADPARLGGYCVEGGETDHRWIIAFLATVVVILLAKPVKDGCRRRSIARSIAIATTTGRRWSASRAS